MKIILSNTQIQKIMNEQTVDSKKNKITKIQQKLISLGYNLGPSGADGVWGKLTDNAWKQYISKKRNKQTPTVSKPVSNSKYTPPSIRLGSDTPQRDTFEPYKQDTMNKLKAGELMKKLGPLAKNSKTPLHIRGVIDYLMGRSQPFTASDLTKEEQTFLKNTILSYPNWKDSYYKLWNQLGAGNLPSSIGVTGAKKELEQGKGGLGKLLNPSLAGQFKYFLGGLSPANVQISPDRKNITIKDTYDFRQENQTDQEILKNASDTLKNFVKGDVGIYQVIRNLVSTKETSGYKGFPVNITL